MNDDSPSLHPLGLLSLAYSTSSTKVSELEVVPGTIAEEAKGGFENNFGKRLLKRTCSLLRSSRTDLLLKILLSLEGQTALPRWQGCRQCVWGKFPKSKFGSTEIGVEGRSNVSTVKQEHHGQTKRGGPRAYHRRGCESAWRGD
jgi:hypothetical protein